MYDSMNEKKKKRWMWKRCLGFNWRTCDSSMWKYRYLVIWWSLLHNRSYQPILWFFNWKWNTPSV